jgi:hypothetical protein
MADDSSAPATRADLQYFAQGLLKQMDMLHEEISSLWKEFPASEDRMVHQFHVIAEQIHHDAIGANRDEIEVVKDRVTRLERHTGLIKA